MASICAQFSAHFPILDSTDHARLSFEDPQDFTVNKCWKYAHRNEIYDFKGGYKSTHLPLEQRITGPIPAAPNTFLIDGMIELILPTQSSVDKAVEFWAGRKNIAIWTSAVFGPATLGLYLAVRSIAPLIAASTPILGVVFTVASACLITLSFFFAVCNLISYVDAGEELDSWQQIQAHIPYLATFPEKIATIRAKIYEAYRDGKEVIAEQESQLRKDFFGVFESGLVFERLGPPRNQVEPDLRPVWDYVFPELVFVPIA